MNHEINNMKTISWGRDNGNIYFEFIARFFRNGLE